MQGGASLDFISIPSGARGDALRKTHIRQMRRRSLRGDRAIWETARRRRTGRHEGGVIASADSDGSLDSARFLE